MERYKLNVEKMVSIAPSRVCLTTRISKSYKNSLGSWEYREPKKVVLEKKSKPILKRKFHGFKISQASAKKLALKCEYMHLFARSRKIRTFSGKVIPNFKMCFLTLKLPAKQNVPTSKIVVDCLQPFLEQMRKRLGMRNYCYRLEFQKNGNAHFHICTDTYIDYYYALRHWNRILNKLGFIDTFSEKMSKHSFVSYCDHFGKDYQGKSIPQDVLLARFRKGKKEKWRNPNTVDVRPIRTIQEVSRYVSKYLTKDDNSGACNENDNEENSFAIRLCYWSRSLSRMQPEALPEQYFDADLVKMLSSQKCATVVYFDYCTVIYFDIEKVTHHLRRYLMAYFRNIEYEENYIPA